MNLGFVSRIGWTALLLWSGWAAVCAQEPARSRGTPITFSGPKSDAVSTNLNDLRTPVTPLQNLESQLKQSFQGLDNPRAEPDLRESRRMRQQVPPMNRQTLKDRLNQQAEEMFLNPDLSDPSQDDPLFQLDKISLDSSRSKSRNSLERFDERQQAERATLTNRASGNNLFGEKSGARPDDFKSEAKPFKAGRYGDMETGESLSVFPRTIATNGATASVGRSTSIRDPSALNRPGENPLTRQQTGAQTRMEDFKRLLEGPRYAPPTTARSGLATAPANYGRPNTSALTPTPSARPTTAPSATPEWSAFKSTTKVETKPDFAKSANLVGSPEKLQALPEFPSAATALEPVKPVVTTPAPIKKKQPTTFKLPKRGF